MKKNKTKKISGCVFLAAFAAVAAIVLIKTGAIKTVNLDAATDSTAKTNLGISEKGGNTVFQGAPFGEKAVIFTVYESDYDETENESYIKGEFKFKDGKAVGGSSIVTFNKIKNLSYITGDIPFYSSQYDDKLSKISYSGFFVPRDCVAVYVGDKKQEVFEGEITATQGKLSFKYCTMTFPFDYYANNDFPELSLMDEAGKKHVIENDDTD